MIAQRHVPVTQVARPWATASRLPHSPSSSAMEEEREEQLAREEEERQMYGDSGGRR